MHMKITDLLQIKRELERGGKRKGPDRPSASGRHPARELVNGIVRFNGSGGSGHTGPAERVNMAKRGTPVVLCPREDGPMLPSAKSRRTRKNKWVRA